MYRDSQDVRTQAGRARKQHKRNQSRQSPNIRYLCTNMVKPNTRADGLSKSFKQFGSSLESLSAKKDPIPATAPRASEVSTISNKDVNDTPKERVSEAPNRGAGQTLDMTEQEYDDECNSFIGLGGFHLKFFKSQN